MFKTTQFVAILIIGIGVNSAHAQTADQARRVVRGYNINAMQALARDLAVQRTAELQEARSKGFKVSFTVEPDEEKEFVTNEGYYAELRSVSSDGKPIYYKTLNEKAAEFTRTSIIADGGSSGLNLDGEGMTIYLWDGGTARTNHQEFGSRLTVGDSDTGYNGLGSDHATHVAGTLLASGVNAKAKGMAPKALGKTFDWGFDASEVVAAAAAGMLISNHSYGYAVRDEFGVPALPPSYFGGYLSESRAWDQIMYQAPYYLMVCAAGNEGLDDTANTSPRDGNAQFDKLTGHCVSKNGLVVANARDVAIDSQGELQALPQIVGSSSEGPTDDLRIKPDITGNGFEVFSTLHLGINGNTNDKYGQVGWTGTSMASPNVAGTLLLLQQLYEEKNRQFMKAATLKAIALHTTDEGGIDGPDAVFGWGVMNARRAAETIAENGSSSLVLENSLAEGDEFTKTFRARGNVRVSLCWTDPPGDAIPDTKVNSTTAALKNDLDLRVERDGSVLLPWRLVSATANERGDNVVDPFERIDDESSSEIREYSLTVSHKGSLTDGKQDFSVVVTGDALELVEQDLSPMITKASMLQLEKDMALVLERLERIEEKLSKPENIFTRDSSMAELMEGIKVRDWPEFMKALQETQLNASDTNSMQEFFPQKSVRPDIGTPEASK